MGHQQDAQVRNPYRGHEILVWARRDERGAWRDEVQVYVDGARIERRGAGRPRVVDRAEALREGIESVAAT